MNLTDIIKLIDQIRTMADVKGEIKLTKAMCGEYADHLELAVRRICDDCPIKQAEAELRQSRDNWDSEWKRRYGQQSKVMSETAARNLKAEERLKCYQRIVDLINRCNPSYDGIPPNNDNLYNTVYTVRKAQAILRGEE